jgi:hypothetical protein
VKRRAAYLVVAGWGLFNGLLVGILAAYGGTPTELWLYAGVAGIVELWALAVLVSEHLGTPEQARYRIPVGGGAGAMPAAFAGGLGAASWVFGTWMLLPAAVLGMAALGIAVHTSRNKGRAT